MSPPDKHPLYQVKLVREGRPSYSEAISQPGDAASFFQKRFGKSTQEHFLVLCLNARNVPLGWREVSRGTLNASLVHPREVFLPAIKLAAGCIILIHNHPSTDPTPSPEDIQLTRRIAQAGELLGIEVLDHLVITDTSHISFKESRLF
ncbi:DNA repair protein RadC [Candidatus Kaiserbacteria bacterium CG10_big_fil_rev_8_21_14_0_10_51_14]|uniref:DNA repair protein RadC n=1 Tax=Candidatus Kaiserbacteria bacterium CG10_big_fil_rev_8_21_14_0_10_51_14 TaxID=1974610 RepID=A0A2H0UBT7_9BACT|nr:MAG: DNA repair protein RadC [Candidatus Kaiserbacteria bacterium CG10_big_fil_rev_8_21_14_0_10_51_14]